MNLVNFDETLIIRNLEGKNSSEVLQCMAANLCKQGYVKESYADAIIAREAKFATGLPTNGYGVAIPHTDIEHVYKSAISFAVLRNPVEFGVMGEETEKISVKLVFMLAMHDSHSQLTLLQNLMSIVQDEEGLKYLATEECEIKIKDTLTEKLHLNASKIILPPATAKHATR
jgi:PTS system galactitol-specific IIA component